MPDSAQPKSRAAAALPFVVAALLIAAVAFFLVDAPEDRPLGTAAGGGHQGGAPAEPADAAAAEARCAARAGKPFVVGTPPSEPADAGEDELDLEPFAAEVGLGAVLENGYAVGVRREQGGSPVAEVVLLDPSGADGRRVELGRSRGDMDPPLVRPRAGGWVASLLEPHASGLTLTLAGSISGKKLVWGAELEQGRDESLAHDMAFAKSIGVIAWDDVTDDGKRGLVRLATVDAATLERRGELVEASGEAVDAEMPRLITRPGGFWLAYSARKRASKTTRAVDASEDDRFAAERIEPSWVELVPLDAKGALVGEAKAVTPAEGHVLGFDLELGEDGAALIAWRDDDTPTGAQGGRVTLVLVSASGASQKQLVAEEGVGAGVPVLLPGWLAIADAEGHTALAPLAADGVIEGAPRHEPLLGRGQVLAARGDELLLAEPRGRAVLLSVVRCTRGGATDPPDAE